MLQKDPKKRIPLHEICNEKWVLKQQQKSKKSLINLSKTKIEEPSSTEINVTGYSTLQNRNSINNNYSGFKNYRLKTKSKSEIIYNKNLMVMISQEKTIEEKKIDDDIIEEGEINHSKYCLETKFFSKSCDKANNLTFFPRFFDDYSVFYILYKIFHYF